MTRTTLAAALAVATLASPALAVAADSSGHDDGTTTTSTSTTATSTTGTTPTTPSPTPGKGNGNGKGHGKATGAPRPGPGANPAAKGKAYGRYCQNQSKKHVKGERGTAFSRCVTALAKVAQAPAAPTPAEQPAADAQAKKVAKLACKTLSKKHVEGQKGTPYSRCIVAAAQLAKATHSS